MCGITGYFETRAGGAKKTKARLPFLLTESEVRGSDATGIGYIAGDSPEVLKQAENATTFITSRPFLDFMEDKSLHPDILIGHTRAQTKGDKKHNGNNHPLFNHRLMVVHNGIISNDDDLFERYHLKRHHEVDSEIVLSLLTHFLETKKLPMIKAIQKIYENIHGSAAIAVLDAKDPTHLYLARRTSPISMLYEKTTGTIYFASEDTIVKNGAIPQKPILNWFLEDQENNYIIKSVPDSVVVTVGKKDITWDSLPYPTYTESHALPVKRTWSCWDPILYTAGCSTEQLEARLDVLDGWLKKNIALDYKEISEKRKIEDALYYRYEKEYD